MPPKRQAGPQVPTTEPPAAVLQTQGPHTKYALPTVTRWSSELTPISPSEPESFPNATPADVVPTHELREEADMEDSPEHDLLPAQPEPAARCQTTYLCGNNKGNNKKELGQRTTKFGKMVAETAAECRPCQQMGKR
jgi:hypothetical protein